MTCNLCPRNCGAERTPDRPGGVCGQPAAPVVARAMLHQWEEPCLVGERGAGAVFFSGCNLRCVYCQNKPISQGGVGKPVSAARLREIFQELIAQGAHNLNFVNPTHYAHVLAALLEDWHPPVPVVFNTGGYDNTDTLQRLEGKVNIYLPDLKYLDRETARRYSGASNYPETAQAAIREMVRQTGPCRFDDNRLLLKGTIIRHLILPGQVSQAKEVMDWVAREFGPGTVLFSLMSQYTPWGDLSPVPELNRRLRPGEIRAAREYMENLGLPGFTQERTSAREEYTPPFDLTGI